MEGANGEATRGRMGTRGEASSLRLDPHTSSLPHVSGHPASQPHPARPSKTLPPSGILSTLPEELRPVCPLMEPSGTKLHSIGAWQESSLVPMPT